ncbi:MAG: UDP-3-O-(3-hydroxymyristoyl)glucosamine N-acyltransferase [Helicobacter sp.]|nr:UDP-3-O-(3-hydroxymyristoyl)glucosamine N-acyltransferase [Helicobacter sp.]
MKLQKIAEYLQIPLSSGREIEIHSLASLDEAKQGQISFVMHSKYIPMLAKSQASALLVRECDVVNLKQHNASIIPLVCDDPHVAIARLSKLFAKPLFGGKNPPQIDPSAQILERVSIGNGSIIGARTILMQGVVVGENVRIGEDCILYPNVVIYADTVLCNRVFIHASSVIGGDGFGYARCKKTGENIKIYHNGIVYIEDDVEIGANSAIDRAVFGQTRIKKGAKIDNLVQVGHNCSVGEFSLIAGQAGLAGSTTLGRNVVMAGQTGAAGHLHIGDNTTLTVRSTASKSLAPNKVYSGYPSYEHKEWLKMQALLRKMTNIKRWGC